MKKYLLPSALILGLSLVLGLAQTINKGVQLSQDPTGPVGVDTNNNIYWPAHMLNTGAAPSIAFCGTSPSVTGTDTAGIITSGTAGPTTCVVTFKAAYLATPWCTVSAQTIASLTSYTVSTAGIALVMPAGANNVLYNYTCSGSK